MKRKIAVFTGTRAEYGLLFWLMKGIQASEQLTLQVIVTGMHLSPEFGETWKQIEKDGFAIDAKVEMLLSSDSSVGVAKSIGIGTVGFADALDRLKPDVLVVLGDRFEALAIAQVALVMRIPIAHLHGGELTEGAYDNAIRHAITKMATLHFVAAEPYQRRVIQMGELPDRVFNVGALGLDHFLRGVTWSHEKLCEHLGFALHKDYFLVTYHPVTLANEDPETVFKNVLVALEHFPEYHVIVTYPNADNGGRVIINILEDYARARSNRVLAVPSLGFERYLSAMSRAAAVIGNSSSGLVEAPSFGVPTVNIGARQQGRLCANTVVNCATDVSDIISAIQKSLSNDFLNQCRDVVNPYGQGDTAGQIISVLEKNELPVIKYFYDLACTI